MSFHFYLCFATHAEAVTEQPPELAYNDFFRQHHDYTSFIIADHKMPTRPGFNANFDQAKYPATIRESLRRLADHFYVTRSFDAISIGNSVYYAALIRPTDETSVYLNTQRELAVVFAPYETFEIRTLEAYDEVYRLTESSRVDDSIRFLISDDSTVESQIRVYVQGNPEYPVIVPMYSDQLTRSGGNPLIRAVQTNFVIRDLFGFQAPLRQEYFFFGRHATVNSVIDLAKSGQNSSLFGLRKSGKTSTIYALQRRASASKIAVVVIDCQDPAVHARDFKSLLWYCVNQIRKSVGGRQVRYADMAILGLPETSEAVHEALEQTLKSTDKQVVLVFDEIENISPETAASAHWRRGKDTLYFWQILRSYYQAQQKPRMSFCLVGTSPALLETTKIEGVDNPVYLFCQKAYIPSLSFDDLRHMIERLGFFMGLNFSPERIADIHKRYGGHPFFSRQLCSRMHRLADLNRPISVSLSLLDRADSEFHADLEGYLAEILTNLRNLYPNEFDVLVRAIKGDSDDLHALTREIPDVLDHLCGYGLVTRAEDEHELAFASLAPAARRAFPELFSDGTQVWAEIVQRRGAIEQELRAALKFDAKRLGQAEWENILSSSLTGKRFSDLADLSPAYLCSNSTSPFYLSDLANIIKDKRVMPYAADSRQQLVETLYVINALRRDAHAMEVTSDELSRFRKACAFAEHCLT